MIWERWISQNKSTDNINKPDQSISESISTTPAITALNKNPNSEVPDLLILDSKKANENVEDKANNTVNISNNDLILRINLLGGKIDYAELLKQKSLSSETENTILLNKNLRLKFS